MEPNVPADGVQETVPVYCAVSVIVVTGAAPLTGTVTPGIAAILIVVAVVGNAAVTIPELAVLVSDVVPATVKKSAATPVKVKPVLAVSVIVAVYCVSAANIPVGNHSTVPVYCAVSVTVVTGVAPLTGTVTPWIAAMFIVVAVAGKTAVITPELAVLVSVDVPATVKKSAATPASVNPVLAVSVIVAV